MEKDGTQTETVLTADSLLGPYTVVRSGLRPLDMSGGDFDLVVAPDGKAYYYFERVHSELVCADLTSDYTDVTGYYSTHFPRPYPPFVREAPAHFMRNGKHYLITSGTTGYWPNPSEIAVADSWHGPYRLLGNPHPNDASNTSYHTQVSSVFKVPNKRDLYIACADRWVPDCMECPYEIVRDAFISYFSGVKNPEAEKRMAAYRHSGQTQIADYVWLPFRFDGDMPILDWRDEWSPDDFE